MELIDDRAIPPVPPAPPIAELDAGVPRDQMTSLQLAIADAWRSGRGVDLARIVADLGRSDEARLAAAQALARTGWYVPRGDYDAVRGVEECLCVAALRDPNAAVRQVATQALATRYEAQDSLAWMPLRVRQTLETVAIDDPAVPVYQTAALILAKADRQRVQAEVAVDRLEAQEAMRFVARAHDYTPELGVEH